MNPSLWLACLGQARVPSPTSWHNMTSFSMYCTSQRSADPIDWCCVVALVYGSLHLSLSLSGLLVLLPLVHTRAPHHTRCFSDPCTPTWASTQAGSLASRHSRGQSVPLSKLTHALPGPRSNYSERASEAALLLGRQVTQCLGCCCRELGGTLYVMPEELTSNHPFAVDNAEEDIMLLQHSFGK